MEATGLIRSWWAGRRRGCGDGLVAVVLLLAAVPAGGQEVVWSGSLGYIEGRYGLTESSRSLVLVNTVSLDLGVWSIYADVPVYDLSGPATRFAGGRPLPPMSGQGGNGNGDGDGGGHGPGGAGRRGGGHGNGGGQGAGGGGGGGGGGGHGEGDDEEEVEPLDTTGVGDPLLGVQLELRAAGGRLGLYASVKVPVNDADRAYATGEWDAGAGAIYRRAFGRWYGRAEAGWWRLGDPPEGDLRDPWAVRLEVGRALGRWWAAAAGEAVGETVPGYGTASSLGLELHRRVGGDARLGVVLTAGLSDAAPDLAVALEWAWAL